MCQQLDNDARKEEEHGDSQQDQRPGTVGLLDALESRCDVKDIADCISSGSGRKLMKDKVFPKVYKQDLCMFECSTLKYAKIYCSLL